MDRCLHEYNRCHNPAGPGGGQFCGNNASKAPARFKPKRIWPFGIKIPYASTRRPKHLKIDNQGRVTYEAATFAQILDEERRRIREMWSDAARASSIATRQGRARGKTKTLGKAKKRPEAYDPNAKPDTAGTAKLRQQAAVGAAARKAGVAGQRKDLSDIAAGKAKAVQDKAARAKAAAAAAKKGASSAAAAAKKQTAAEHDAKIKPMVAELQKLAAAGMKGSPEYATKYAAYKSAQAAKRAALGQSTAPEAPEKPKKGAAGGSKARRINVGATRHPKGAAFSGKRLRIRR